MRTVGSRTRQVQIVQPLNHLVPVAPLPVDPLARRTAPELLVARADCGGGESFDLFPRYRPQHRIAGGKAGGGARVARGAGGGDESCALSPRARPAHRIAPAPTCLRTLEPERQARRDLANLL